MDKKDKQFVLIDLGDIIRGMEGSLHLFLTAQVSFHNTEEAKTLLLQGAGASKNAKQLAIEGYTELRR